MNVEPETPDPGAPKQDRSSSDLKRVAKSTGIYAAAATAQKGVGFLLLPVYTRFIEPSQYGVLELISTFFMVVFICLRLGLPSAINKCYHRDARTANERRSVLSTALWLDVPVLLVGSVVFWILAPRIDQFLTGGDGTSELVRLGLLGGLFTSITELFSASLRTRERATEFAILNFVQFVIAISLNIFFVVRLGMGIRGVLLGGALSQVAAVPLAIFLTRHGSSLRPNFRLIAPLLKFGALLVPAMLAAWIMNLSDRYLLRVLANLEDVAIYSVGYRVGMVLQIVIVWPFQLAWPAVSFSISNREGHQETYAKTLTYLVTVLTYGVVFLSLVSKAAVPVLVGPGYTEAYRVVPFVALAYALNGIYFCVGQGIHISGKTRYLPLLMASAAALNIILNLITIPKFGIMGAAASTAGAFLFLSGSASLISNRFYPVPYEYARLAKVVVAGLFVYAIGTLFGPKGPIASVIWTLVMATWAFPQLLWILKFLDQREVEQIKSYLGKVPSWYRGD